MSQIKVIPCLDIREGRVVKGVKFIDLRDARDPVEAAEAYCKEGADELVFLDIFATVENRKTRFDWVKKVADVVTIPFAVGGGISSTDDMKCTGQVEDGLQRAGDLACTNCRANQHHGVVLQRPRQRSCCNGNDAVDAYVASRIAWL